ncbi:MAG TPA: S9 family peptidase, partial [Longimicrobiaceae bacterium]|nr:S9 family peptidase [Longimicrobiaceae bacterium]
MRSMLATALAVFLQFAPLHAQEAQKRAFTPDDWYRVTTLSSPAVSPDGEMVAFTVTTVNEKENRRHNEVWAVQVDGGEPFRLTAPGTESSDPRWSPDGEYLFFRSDRDGGEGSTWALRMNGPRGEAIQLEDYPTGSMPEDRSFTVSTDPVPDEDDEDENGDNGASDNGDKDDPFAKMAATAKPPFGAVTEPVNPARFDGRHIVERGYKRNGQGYVANPYEAREYRPDQLWMQAFGDTVKHQLTSTLYSHDDAVVSPDGRWIAFTADVDLRPDSVVSAERDSLDLLPYDAVRDEAPRNDSDIYIISIDGGEPRKLAEIMGEEGDLAWSTDGDQLSFISSMGVRTGQEELYIIDSEGGQPREVIGDWQFEPGNYEWMPDGDIMMEATIGGRDAIFRLDPESGEMEELVAGRRRFYGVDYDREFENIAFVASSMTKPTELFIADGDGENERRLTGFNDALNAEIAWADAERFTYESVGGREIEAWMMKPYGYEAGKEYPLVLYIHGGPHSRYGENWFDEFQNLAGAGMWVLFTNPRGSGGYGADFTYSTRGDWGGDDYLDLMKAVDIASRMPGVDSMNMGVTGGSYGGFMTAWITTKTDRFDAAQADRMISNWWSWYGSSDAQGLTEFEFYGEPWDNPEMYDELSPIRYVDQVTTPTLIVQSEEDHRTPMADAEQWFNALEHNGVPAEFVRYPRSNHNL